LQEPYLLGCLNTRNELSLISAGQSRDDLDCRLLGVDDMRPSERAQVIAGLPSGTLDEAISQIEELSRSSVLPVCAPRPTPRPATTPPPSPRPATPPSTPATPATPETPGPSDVPRTSAPAPAPETPRTVTSSPVPHGPPPPSPTVTALPPPPPEPGTNCREVT
ncbi:MAG: serine/threonine protein phosphatase, partial [Mycobacterium sp.]|nr:serine/threonine protein phosphatase [Mycobacterium sp.]